jgi:hypothetical protein
MSFHSTQIITDISAQSRKLGVQLLWKEERGSRSCSGLTTKPLILLNTGLTHLNDILDQQTEEFR